MNQLVKKGQLRTILISISILLVSLHAIYLYNTVFTEAETKKTVQQIVRFILTVGLLIMVYKGKNWARIVLLILSSISGLLALIGLFSIDKSLIIKIPMIVMVIVYSVAVHHFGFSKSYKAFILYQNGEIEE